MMAKLYAQVVGVVLLVLGVAGFVTKSLLGVETTAVHNLIHLISGGWGAYAGFANGLGGPKTFAQVFGVIYTVVGVLGFVSAGTLSSLGVHVNSTYNIIHIAVGLWGVWAGFMSKGQAA